MKKLFRLILTFTLLLFFAGSASAIPVAKFGKYLSDDNIDIWLLSLLCDSDLSITLTTDDAISFLFHNNTGDDAGIVWQGSGSGSQSFSGRVSSGNYYVKVTKDRSDNSSPSYVDPLGDSPYGSLPFEGDFFTDEGFTGTQIDVTVSPVPEPAAIFLLGMGLLFIGGTVRKMKS